MIDRAFENAGAAKGVGVGLALARAVAEQHDGELIVRSVLGGGTFARLRLPLREPAHTAKASKTNNGPA